MTQPNRFNTAVHKCLCSASLEWTRSSCLLKAGRENHDV